MDSVVYTYNKKRSLFGKQPIFSSTSAEMLDSINPNPTEQKLYCLRNPVHREVQVYAPKAQREINTISVKYKGKGINHAEGGWPKEVNYQNEEETTRYRRRIEREDNYVQAIMRLAPKFEHFINQNNAIELYEHYYKEIPKSIPLEKPDLKLANLYRDPDQRPVSCLCWTNEDDPKLAVAHCNKIYPASGPVNQKFTCHIWDLENPESPAFEFEPPTACWKIVSSPINPAIIIGGLDNGTVCVFDIRAEKEPMAISSLYMAHRDPVSALLYLQSRLNNEFFSGSSDGQCIWYDIRNLSEPMDTMIMSVNIPPGETANLSNSESVSVLQFERAFPTKFLCGTDTGLVINVNRKGKSHSEIMSAIFNAHKGPVRAIHRSPCLSKMFITCGDWTTHIWSDDIRSCPIISGMSHRYQVMDVAWSPQRYSGYMTVSVDGNFRFWDMLRSYRKPVISLPVSKFPLLYIAPHEEGRLIAMGGELGTVFLVALSEDLVISGDNDKHLMLQIYDRESRREHILEGRLKEIRLKHKLDEEAVATQTEEVVVDEEAQLRAVEDEYRRQVIEEIRRAGYPQNVTAFDSMRHR